MGIKISKPAGVGSVPFGPILGFWTRRMIVSVVVEMSLKIEFMTACALSHFRCFFRAMPSLLLWLIGPSGLLR